MEAAANTDAPGRLTELADKLDCFTEPDLLLLADVKPDTADAWRKRGEGPAYVRVGRRVLYPRAAVAEWLHARVRERRTVPAVACL